MGKPFWLITAACLVGVGLSSWILLTSPYPGDPKCKIETGAFILAGGDPYLTKPYYTSRCVKERAKQIRATNPLQRETGEDTTLWTLYQDVQIQEFNEYQPESIYGKGLWFTATDYRPFELIPLADAFACRFYRGLRVGDRVNVLCPGIDDKRDGCYIVLDVQE